MERCPPAYPYQVVADWIATNDVHVLTDSVEKVLLAVTWSDRLSPLDYDVCTRRARKMQAEAIGGAGPTIGRGIVRVVSHAISSLCNHWRTRRQIERLSYLTSRLLDDMGLPHDIQVRARALQSHRQSHGLHFYF